MTSKRPKKPEIKIANVSTDDSKFSFKVELVGRWDWNDDIATEQRRFPADRNTLERALQDVLAEEIFSRCDGMFDTVKVLDVEFTNEMRKVYDDYRKAKEAAAREERTETEEAELQRALEVVNRYVNK